MNKIFSIEFPSAITEIDFRILFDSKFDVPKGLLATIECFDANMQAINPQILNWSYSKSLNKAFEYLSSTDENRVSKPKQLVSKRPIKYLTCEIRPWAMVNEKVESTGIAFTATVNKTRKLYATGFMSKRKNEGN